MASASHNLADPWTASGLPQRQQAFLKQYFEALDAEPEKGARNWANSFAEGGKFVNGTMVIESSKDLEQERYGYWKAWPHLYHVVKRIYLLPGAEHSDFVVIGNWAVKRPDGSTLERDTAANFHLVDQRGELKIQKMEVYADPTPLLEIMNS
ncbi:uncharacterized protein A1O9_10863 [Exophiala aquamarina CBS 119918]|uniref:SnoaL-like domain-containing protein n=1 Tax=Exophiala aquamarina CBS 119918 TaxID=1182545 RepID=A0A072NZV7_9EURO|nr:uncharacterized protein A1O9_10863 [Exophiala aquamarina CBS 119918]KEF52957.1 hypothetical protein A1O9_10863 [Exophiala aquamarina CBS 119918]